MEAHSPVSTTRQRKRRRAGPPGIEALRLKSFAPAVNRGTGGRSCVQLEVNRHHTLIQGTARAAISLCAPRHAARITGFMLLATLSLVGCATPFRAPPDVAHIKLERVDSPVVIVEKIWLERKNGPLMVKGSVLKRLSANDTTQTHLDVTLYGQNGQVLRSTIENFEPRQIRRQWRRPGIGTYRVVLDPLPAGTARIEVRAHEGVHPSPVSSG